jgi:hypothetical protein
VRKRVNMRPSTGPAVFVRMRIGDGLALVPGRSFEGNS